MESIWGQLVKTEKKTASVLEPQSKSLAALLPARPVRSLFVNRYGKMDLFIIKIFYFYPNLGGVTFRTVLPRVPDNNQLVRQGKLLLRWGAHVLCPFFSPPKTHKSDLPEISRIFCAFHQTATRNWSKFRWFPCQLATVASATGL